MRHLRPAFDSLLKLVAVATGGYRSQLFEIFSTPPGKRPSMELFLDPVGKTWFDYESGRWHALPQPIADTRRKVPANQ